MNSLSAPLRRRVSRALRNSKPFRDADKRQRRLEHELTRQQQDAKGRARQQDELRAQVKRLTTSMAALDTRIKPAEYAEALRQTDHARLLSQVAVFEERLARLEQLAEPQPVDVGGDVAEARTLLDEVRTEHAQVRARMQVIGWYEERLRRVESSVATLYDGDKRHPV